MIKSLSRRKIVLFSIVIVLLGAALFFGYTRSTKEKTVIASTSSSTISTKAQWDLGYLSNVSSQDPGDIKINMKAATNIGTYSGMTATSDIRPEYAVPRCVGGETPSDNCQWTNGWSVNYISEGDGHWWQLDMLETKESISGIHIANDYCWECNNTITVSTSTDGINFVDAPLIPKYDNSSCSTFDFVHNVDARYIRIIFAGSPILPSDTPHAGAMVLYFNVFNYGQSAHTSAATQIDGSEGGAKNFVKWEVFTPTQTVPANTSVEYRFRTSPDGSSWTAWSSYQTPSSGDSLDISAIAPSGGGANKYLQVETSLKNTDGTSTPTVDSYSVGYHTDVKPNKPTAATAVVQ